MIVSKKNKLASMLASAGILRLLELLPRQPQLLVLNYHRIGDSSSSPFDPGVFSTSVDGFEAQICLLKDRYKFATVKDALEIIEGKRPVTDTQILVTFDDGYRDNFKEAFPVLQRHGVEAIFFVVTSSIETAQVPWWDQIAYLAKTHAPKSLRITYPRLETFDLAPDKFESSLRNLLLVFKSPATADPALFLAMLKNEVGRSNEELNANLSMSWDDLRAMVAGGMTIGLHTHSHPILSKLSLADQIDELAVSKKTISEKLGMDAAFLSYPVGCRASFNADTIVAAREVGLRAGFSFYGGTNRPGKTHQFDVHRVAFESYIPLSRVRLSLSLMAVTGKLWI